MCLKYVLLLSKSVFVLLADNRYRKPLSQPKYTEMISTLKDKLYQYVRNEIYFGLYL